MNMLFRREKNTKIERKINLLSCFFNRNRKQIPHEHSFQGGKNAPFELYVGSMNNAPFELAKNFMFFHF